MKNQIGKRLPGKGNLEESDKLKKLASETGAEEFDLELGTLYDEYKESGFNGTFNEYLDKIGDDKGIDVMPGETISQYVKRIRSSEDK